MYLRLPERKEPWRPGFGGHQGKRSRCLSFGKRWSDEGKRRGCQDFDSEGVLLQCARWKLHPAARERPRWCLCSDTAGFRDGAREWGSETKGRGSLDIDRSVLFGDRGHEFLFLEADAGETGRIRSPGKGLCPGRSSCKQDRFQFQVGKHHHG